MVADRALGKRKGASAEPPMFYTRDLMAKRAHQTAAEGDAETA